MESRTMMSTLKVAKSELEHDPDEKLITITLLREDFSQMVQLTEKEMLNNASTITV